MMRLIKILVLFFLLGSCFEVSAQLKFFAGANYSSVRNEVLKNEEPVFGWHFGGGATFYPIAKWEKFSFDVNTGFMKRGYKQYAGDWYYRTFFYFGAQLLGNYSAADFLTVQAGVDVSGLFDTNVEHGLETYNTTDVNLLAGVSFFENKRQGFYVRFMYGLTPMLTYNSPDAMGNFTNIKDLKNICVTMGLRFNIYDKKISF